MGLDNSIKLGVNNIPKTFIMKRSQSTSEKRLLPKLKQVIHEVSLKRPVVLKATPSEGSRRKDPLASLKGMDNRPECSKHKMYIQNRSMRAHVNDGG